MLGLIVGSALLLNGSGSPSPQSCAYDEKTERVVASANPQVKYEAGAKPAFATGSFELGGATYQKYGNLRPFTPAELRGFTRLGDAMLFIAEDFNEDVLYVLTSSAGCMFQPYFKKA